MTVLLFLAACTGGYPVGDPQTAPAALSTSGGTVVFDDVIAGVSVPEGAV